MTNRRRFFADNVFIFIAYILSKLSYVLCVPAFTSNLTQSQFGIWIQIWVTVGFLIPITSLCIDIAAVRYLAGNKDKIQSGRIAASMFIILSASLVCILLFLISIAPLLSSLMFNSPHFIHLVYLSIAWLAVKVIFLFFSSILRAYEEFRKYGLLMLMDAASLLVFAYTLIRVTHQIELLLYALIIFGGLLSGVAFFLVRKHIHFLQPSWMETRDILYYSLPLVPNAALAWTINASDRFFITHMLSLAENAVYSVTYTVSNIIFLLFAPLGIVLFPLLCHFWNQDGANYRNEISRYVEYTFRYSLMIAIPMIAGLFGLWPSVVSLFSSSQYITGRLLMLTISTGILFSGINLINGYILQLKKKTRTIMLVSFLGALLNLGLNFILIPEYGLMGAGIATLISYLAMAGITMTIARRIVWYSIQWRRIFTCLFISFAMGSILWVSRPPLFLGILMGGIFYILLIIPFRLIDKSEISHIKTFISYAFYRNK